MIVSLRFVNEFVTLPTEKKISKTPAGEFSYQHYCHTRIADTLTLQGFEVEEITVRGRDLDLLVVGQIKTAEKHQNADKLQVCQVDIGSGELQQIVCGAPNARPGLFVAVALPGVTLPGEFKIKKSKIRDVESNGMLCAREELQLPTIEAIDGNGIWEISVPEAGGKKDDELKNLLGQPLFHALDLYDVIFNMDVTPNRPDVLNHSGVAREIMAGFNFKNETLQWKTLPWDNLGDSVKTNTVMEEAVSRAQVTGEIPFALENPLGKPIFFTLFKNAKATPSPAKLRNLLEAIDQNSVNSIVDISNLLLLGYGQPSHAFCYHKLAQPKLVIQEASGGEAFVGLDGKERTLSSGDPIASDGTPQGLLGILGGDKTKVDETSTTIVFEVAYPDPVKVRRVSRKYGRITDSSFRFEKGIDPWQRWETPRLFAGLYEYYTGHKLDYEGSVGHMPKAFLTNLESTPKINFKNGDLKRIVGKELVPFPRQIELFKSLGFEIASKSSEEIDIIVPTWRRADVQGSADLVEEVLRVVGVDKLPSIPLPPSEKITLDDPMFEHAERLREKAVALGYHETLSFHMQQEGELSKMGLSSESALGEPLALRNPIMKDHPFMVSTLIPNLLKAVAKNQGFGQHCGQVFEITRTFQNLTSSGERAIAENGEGYKLHSSPSKLYDYNPSFGGSYSDDHKQTPSRPVETLRLAGVSFGDAKPKHWQNTQPEPFNIFHGLAHVEQFIQTLGISGFQREPLPDDHPVAPACHPGRRALVQVFHRGKTLPVGWVAEIHPKVLRAFDTEGPAVTYEINAEILYKIAKEQGQKKVSHRLSGEKRLQRVKRDFAFLLDDTVTAQQIESTVTKALKPTLKKELKSELIAVHTFDVYKGKNVPKGKMSLAFHVLIQPLETSLKDGQIETLSQTVITSIKDKLSGEMR